MMLYTTVHNECQKSRITQCRFTQVHARYTSPVSLRSIHFSCEYEIIICKENDFSTQFSNIHARTIFITFNSLVNWSLSTPLYSAHARWKEVRTDEKMRRKADVREIAIETLFSCRSEPMKTLKKKSVFHPYSALFEQQ